MHTEAVYTYTDYRAFLADWYADQKARDPRFSYRRLSDLCGFKTKDFIYRVIQGEKNLSAESITRVAAALRLTKRRAAYFEVLIRFNQAKTHQERDRFFQELSSLRKTISPHTAPELIQNDQFRIFSERHHLVIRSLIGMYEFKDDYVWLCSMVHPPITVSKARKSVELLAELGFINRDDTGRWRVTSASITTGDQIKMHSLHKHYLDDMQRAATAMDETPRSLRNISGLTLGISEKTYATIVERIETFRREIAQLADQDSDADRVYALNFHLFPLSKIAHEETRDKES